MSDFNKFLQLVKTQLTDIAQEGGEDIKDELLEDGLAFVEKTRDDLKRWSQLLAEGKLSRDEFEYLLKAKKDLAQMEALKKKGLALARIDKLKGSLLDTVAGAAIRTLAQITSI